MTLAICQLAGFRIVREYPGTKSELSPHQMAPGGVVAHSSSWTPAAYEPYEVLLLRLFGLRQSDSRFGSTRPPVACCYWIPI